MTQARQSPWAQWGAAPPAVLIARARRRGGLGLDAGSTLGVRQRPGGCVRSTPPCFSAATTDQELLSPDGREEGGGDVGLEVPQRCLVRPVFGGCFVQRGFELQGFIWGQRELLGGHLRHHEDRLRSRAQRWRSDPPSEGSPPAPSPSATGVDMAHNESTKVNEHRTRRRRSIPQPSSKERPEAFICREAVAATYVTQERRIGDGEAREADAGDAQHPRSRSTRSVGALQAPHQRQSARHARR